MAVLALLLLVGFLGFGLGARSWLVYRRTGASPFRGLTGRRGLVDRLSGSCTAFGGLGLVAAPLLDLAGVLRPLPAVAGRGWQVVGTALALVGFACTQWAVGAMGASWRVGVDHSERTRLVTDGPFRHVRNPVYTAIVATAVGLATMVPNAVAWGSVGLLVVGLELQVRAVEEPHLLRVHGAAYRAYASRVGRFVPGLGRRATRPSQGETRAG